MIQFETTQKHGYRDLEYPITNPFYIREQRHGFTAVIRDTHLTHMPLVSAILNYLSASDQTLYDMALSSVTKETLCGPPYGTARLEGRQPPKPCHSQPV
jgi:hypothetical protein